MNSQVVVEREEKKPAKATAGPALIAVPGGKGTAAPGLQRPLFSQSFVELSGTDRRRKRATAATSFIVQAIIVGILVLIPLWFTDMLPTQQLATFLVAPPPPPPPPPPAAPAIKVTRIVSEVMNGQLMAPNKIPRKVQMIKEEETPPPSGGGVIGGVEGGVPGGQIGGVLGSILSAGNKTTAPQVAVPKRLRVSTGISEGLLLRRVEPVYPLIAQRARVEGTVQLRAIISKEGNIENLQLISGHPILVSSAMDAVKQWKYRPYILNGEPLEVETVVIVNFHIH